MVILVDLVSVGNTCSINLTVENCEINFQIGILRRPEPHKNLALFNGVDSYITKF